VRSVSIATTEEWRRRTGGEAFLYMNDCSRDQNPLPGYGPDNVARLRAVARKYDPHQVFQNLQQDGFLLRKDSCLTGHQNPFLGTTSFVC
jgi:hypothetical protein